MLKSYIIHKANKNSWSWYYFWEKCKGWGGGGVHYSRGVYYDNYSISCISDLQCTIKSHPCLQPWGIKNDMKKLTYITSLGWATNIGSVGKLEAHIILGQHQWLVWMQSCLTNYPFLATYEIFPAEVCDFWQVWYQRCQMCTRVIPCIVYYKVYNSR